MFAVREDEGTDVLHKPVMNVLFYMYQITENIKCYNRITAIFAMPYAPRADSELILLVQDVSGPLSHLLLLPTVEL